MGFLIFLVSFLMISFGTGSLFIGLFCSIFLTAFVCVLAPVTSPTPAVTNQQTGNSQSKANVVSEVVASGACQDDDFLMGMMHQQLRRRVHGSIGYVNRGGLGGYGGFGRF